LECPHKDGHPVYLESSGVPVLGADGALFGYRGVTRDVTKRRQDQLTLRLQAARAEALLELPRLAERHDEAGFLQRAQDLVEYLTGSVSAFTHFVHPEDETIELAACSTGTRECNGKADFDTHYPIHRAGLWADAYRQQRPVLCNDYGAVPDKQGLPAGHAPLARLISIPVIERGRVVMLASVGNKPEDYTELDVESVELLANEVWRIVQRRRSEADLEQHRQHLEELVAERTAALDAANAQLKASEERFQLALDASKDGLWDWDLQTDTGYLSPSYSRMLGYTPGELGELTQRHLIDLLHPDDHPEQFLERLRKHLQQDGGYEIEFRLRAKDGGYKWILSRGKVVGRDVQGRPTRAVGTHTDLTARKTLELELREAKEQAEAASRAKSVFLANMSHEIRTPLNAIIGLAHLLMTDQGVGQLPTDQLRKIDSAAKHLLSIISDILDLSKIEAGKLRLATADFELGSLLNQIASILSEPTRSKGLTLEIAPGPVPLWLRGDSIRLRQALLNLAGNAVKFTEQGEVRLSARLLSQDQEALRVRFEVTDTGIGIAEDKLGRLFLPFEQLDDGVSRRFEGTGLGLTITYRLVELMGGYIGVDSTPGQGSRFWLDVPLQAGRPADRPPQTTDSRDAAARLLAQRPPPRILLAEDNAINREVATEVLRRVGIEPVLARDGTEAVKHAGEGAFDLMLMDMRMPGLDGLEATRRIRAMDAHRTTPIIAMTANAFEDDRQACLDAGMNDFVAKPVEPNTLYQVIAMALPTLPLAQTATPGPGVGVPDSAEDAWQTLPTEVREAPGWDARAGLRHAGDDPALYLKLLRHLPRQHSRDVERVLFALQEKDLHQALLLTHRLKGSAAILGLRTLAEAAARCETVLRSGDPDAVQAIDVGPLAEALQTVLECIGRIPDIAASAAPSTRDDTQVLAVVKELEALLQTDDTAAEDIFVAHADLLRHWWGEATVAQLSDALDRFDYPMALALVRRQSLAAAGSCD
jgi:PAS domain S-box-containing protein